MNESNQDRDELSAMITHECLGLGLTGALNAHTAFVRDEAVAVFNIEIKMRHRAVPNLAGYMAAFSQIRLFR